MLFGRFNDVREKMMMMMKKIPERSGLWVWTMNRSFVVVAFTAHTQLALVHPWSSTHIIMWAINYLCFLTSIPRSLSAHMCLNFLHLNFSTWKKTPTKSECEQAGLWESEKKRERERGSRNRSAIDRSIEWMLSHYFNDCLSSGSDGQQQLWLTYLWPFRRRCSIDSNEMNISTSFICFHSPFYFSLYVFYLPVSSFCLFFFSILPLFTAITFLLSRPIKGDQRQ